MTMLNYFSNAPLVDGIQTRTRDRVQELFDQAVANIRVQLAQGMQTIVDDDTIIVVDITAIRDSRGIFLRAPDQLPRNNTQSQYVMGRAGMNHLNLNFGGDIIYNPNEPDDMKRLGVFVNRFPYYRDRILDINIRDAVHIGNGIGNVAAHEIGHRLGLVPNPRTSPSDPNPADPNQPRSSEEQRDKIRDDRFTGWTFDGTKFNHTREGVDISEVMSWETFEASSTTGVPYVFGTTQGFRTGTRKDAEYLRTILPK